MPARRNSPGSGFRPALPHSGELRAVVRTIEGPHPLGRVAETATRCLASVVTYVVEWRRRRRSRHELMMLTDLQLWDIGIKRDAAKIEAGKPFWLG